MEIIICSDADEVARVAAGKVARIAEAVGPAVVIGVATGSSPIGLYNELARKVEGGLRLEGWAREQLDRRRYAGATR